jgi:hypothetical protein
MPNPKLNVIRSVKRWHNTDIVLQGPMPSEPCRRSKYALAKHAFTALVRGLDTSSVTPNTDIQIVDHAPLHAWRRTFKFWQTNAGLGAAAGSLVQLSAGRFFPNGLVCWPDRTRRARIGIGAECGWAFNTAAALPGQTRKLATAAAPKGHAPLTGACPQRFAVEDVECRQALVEDFLLPEDRFAARGGVARHRVQRRHRVCERSPARQGQRQPGRA